MCDLAVQALSQYAFQIQSLHLLHLVDGDCLRSLSPVLASRLRHLSVRCMGWRHESELARVLPLCPALQTLTLHMDDVSLICRCVWMCRFLCVHMGLCVCVWSFVSRCLYMCVLLTDIFVCLFHL